MTKRSLLGTTLTGGAALAACAACCAPLLVPLVAPPLAVLFAGGGVALAMGGQIAAAFAVLAGVGAIIGFRLWQARKRAEAARARTCGCPPERGCGPEACALRGSPAEGKVG